MSNTAPAFEAAPYSEPTSLLLSFVAQIAPETRSSTPGGAHDYAHRRGWVTEAGDLTPEGAVVLKSLQEQSGTRSIFRYW